MYAVLSLQSEFACKGAVGEEDDEEVRCVAESGDGIDGVIEGGLKAGRWMADVFVWR